MTDVTVSDRSRIVLSWGVFLALVALIAGTVQVRETVADHSRRIQIMESQAASTATKADIERLEARVIRIETLLLSQREPTR